MQHFMKKKNEVFLERQGDQDPYMFLLNCDEALFSQVTGH